MKRSTKAALFSGLVFPGLGHLILKQYLRGSILMLSALIPLSVIVAIAVNRALAVVERIENGEIALETGAITELASSSVSGTDSTIANIAFAVLFACWLFGIFDSYRLGKKQDQ